MEGAAASILPAQVGSAAVAAFVNIRPAWPEDEDPRWVDGYANVFAVTTSPWEMTIRAGHISLPRVLHAGLMLDVAGIVLIVGVIWAIAPLL